MRKWEIFFLMAVLALALLARLAFNEHGLDSFNLSSTNFDSADYHWLAKNLCRLRGYHTFFGTGHDYHLFRSPGHPLYAALVYSIFGIRFSALRLADVVLSAASVVLTYLIARGLAGKKAGVAAALLATFYRPALYYSTQLLTENLLCFLLLLSVYLVTRYRETNWAYAAFGGITGYMILTRPAWMGVAPFLLLWIIASRRRLVLRSTYFLTALAIVLLPWIIYCSVSLNMSPSITIFSSAIGAENTWGAHNPAIGDFVQMGPTRGRGFEEEWKKLCLMRYRHYTLPEQEYIRKLSGEAKEFLCAEPARCIKLGIRRLYRAWLGSGILDGQGTVFPDTGRNPYGVIRWKERILDPGSYFGEMEVIDQLKVRRQLRLFGTRIPTITFEGVFYLMCIAFIACVISHITRFFSRAAEFLGRVSLIILIIIGYSFTNVLGVTVQRYRFPLDYFIIILAGCFIACAGAPLYRLAATAICRPGTRHPPADPAPGAVPRHTSVSPRVWYILIAVLVMVLLARGVQNIASIRADLRRTCGQQMSRDELRALMARIAPGAAPDLDYRTAWTQQMEGLGDLGELLGATVLWRGEATWINHPSLADFEGEFYLANARRRFAPDMDNPGFFRLIVDSYEDPESIGSGRAIIVAPGDILDKLHEGDSIAVMGTLAGTDYIVGSMIVCAREIVKLNDTVGR